MSPKIRRDYVPMAAPDTSPLRALPWADDAKCVGHDPEKWFEPSAEHEPKHRFDWVDEAKQVCSTCPVRGECLEHALAVDERFGIWGGLTADERRRVRRR